MIWRSVNPFSGQSALRRLTDDPAIYMQREIGRVFDDLVRSAPAFTSTAALALRLDIKEDKQAFHVTADLPGLGEADVDVTFDEGVLTIRGEKKVERDETKDTWHLIERSYGSFARQLSLPTNIETNKIEAKFDKGVLTVTLPKQTAEQAKAKKIQVKVS